MTDVHTVFYSWQADLPSRSNRAFIEESLKGAVNELQTDGSLELDIRVDRDTVGLPGSPRITDAILAKISRASVFVPDVSIVATSAEGKACPNPNVLLELGYAIAKLGWDRIVMVMNTAFGEVADLPFDLRGHRVMPYVVDPAPDTPKAEQRRNLERGLKDAIGTILGERQTRSAAELVQQQRDLIREARQFAQTRLDMIGRQQGPVANLTSQRLICIHSIPAGSIAGENTIAVNELDPQTAYLPPFGSTGFNDEFNGDGLLRVSPDGKGKNRSYLQVFPDGRLESVNSEMMIGRGRADGLPGPAFCRSLAEFLVHGIRFYGAIKVVPPICIVVTLVGVRDVPLLVESNPSFVPCPFDRDVVRLSEIVVGDFADGTDPRRLLRPALDKLWQHAGLERCPYFLPNGTWNLRSL